MYKFFLVWPLLVRALMDNKLHCKLGAFFFSFIEWPYGYYMVLWHNGPWCDEREQRENKKKKKEEGMSENKKLSLQSQWWDLREAQKGWWWWRGKKDWKRWVDFFFFNFFFEESHYQVAKHTSGCLSILGHATKYFFFRTHLYLLMIVLHLKNPWI